VGGGLEMEEAAVLLEGSGTFAAKTWCFEDFQCVHALTASFGL